MTAIQMVTYYEVLATELRGLGVPIPSFNEHTLRLLERLSDNVERMIEMQQDKQR